MANRIGVFFDSQPGDAADRIAEHLRDYWEPRMREQLQAHVAAGGAGLLPSVIRAVRQL